jgi:hypothetical protein
VLIIFFVFLKFLGVFGVSKSIHDKKLIEKEPNHSKKNVLSYE